MHGLYLLWWVNEKQVSPATVASILAAGNLALMLCEVPTGWFADRFGHRASLILGSLLQVSGMLWCWLGAGVPGLTIASILVALADAFRSGADQALVYRSCVALDREPDFQTIEARSNAVALCALVTLVVTGGAVVSLWGFAAGWILETVLAAAGLVIACAMTEPPGHAGDRTDDGSGARPPAGPRTLLSWRMALLILPAACLGSCASATAFIAQTADGSGTLGITALVAVITLAEAAGCALAARLPERGVRQQVLLLTMGLGLCLLALSLPLLFHATVLGLSFLVGLAEPLRATAIQRLVSDDVRARAVSLASACDMAIATVALPLAGWWRGRR
jgi:MFS family permease